MKVTSGVLQLIGFFLLVSSGIWCIFTFSNPTDLFIIGAAFVITGFAITGVYDQIEKTKEAANIMETKH